MNTLVTSRKIAKKKKKRRNPYNILYLFIFFEHNIKNRHNHKNSPTYVSAICIEKNVCCEIPRISRILVNVNAKMYCFFLIKKIHLRIEWIRATTRFRIKKKIYFFETVWMNIDDKKKYVPNPKKNFSRKTSKVLLFHDIIVSVSLVGKRKMRNLWFIYAEL